MEHPASDESRAELLRLACGRPPALKPSGSISRMFQAVLAAEARGPCRSCESVVLMGPFLGGLTALMRQDNGQPRAWSSAANGPSKVFPRSISQGLPAMPAGRPPARHPGVPPTCAVSINGFRQASGRTDPGVP